MVSTGPRGRASDTAGSPVADEVMDALDLAGIGYMLCDGRGVPLFLSAAMRESVRLGGDAPLPQVPWFGLDASPDEVKQARALGWAFLMRSRSDWRDWVRWTLPDGTQRIIEGTARVLGDDRVLMIANDRTDRFETMRRLEETEAIQRTILDDLPLSVALQDPEGRIVYVNNYLPDRLGIARDRIIGRLSGEIGVIRPEPQIETLLSKARERAEPLTGTVIDVSQGPLAGTQWAFYGVPLLDRDGTLSQYLSVGVDRTAEASLTREREEFARALARTQRVAALNDFAGALAHELSNILQPVATYARRLSRDPQREDAATLAARIDAAVMTAGRILRRTLSMGRSEDAAPRAHAIRPIVEDVLASARDLAPVGLSYELTVEDDAVGLVQPTELRQILLNLLNNAADAQHYRGVIHIALQGDQIPPTGLHFAPLAMGPFASLSIRDEGPGLPPDALRRIFEPFYTTKKEGRGTGLGLPVALGLVMGWGGTVSATNAPGGGAQFTVWIPQQARTGETPCPES